MEGLFWWGGQRGWECRAGGYPAPLQVDRGWCWPAAATICLCGLLPCGPPSAVRDEGMEAQGAGGGVSETFGQAAASGSTLAELSL